MQNYFKRGFSGGTFLIFIFLLSASSSIVLLFTTNFYDASRLNIVAILYHCLCLYLFLYPIVYVSNNIEKYLPKFSGLGLSLLARIFIIFSIVTYVVLLPEVISILTSDNLRHARYLSNQGALESTTNVGGVISYISAIGSAFSYFSLFLMFYFLAYFREKKTLIILLFVCSFTDVVTSMSMVGRGGVVRWGFMFIFLYLTFKSLIDKKIKKIALKLISVFSIPFVVVFFMITLSRFSDRDNPVFTYILDYLGQPFIYFSYIYEPFFKSTFGGRHNFPFVFPNSSKIEGSLSDIVTSVDFYVNTFSTFVGSFYKDIGFVFTLLLAIIIFVLFLYLFRFTKYPKKFYKTSLFIIFSQIMINGVFYFQYTGTTKMRVFVLLVILTGLMPFVFPKLIKK